MSLVECLSRLPCCSYPSSICTPTANSILSIQSSQARIDSPFSVHNGKSLSVPSLFVSGPLTPYARLFPAALWILGKTESKVCIPPKSTISRGISWRSSRYLSLFILRSVWVEHRNHRSLWLMLILLYEQDLSDSRWIFATHRLWHYTQRTALVLHICLDLG